MANCQKINVFPSESCYNDHLGECGENDLNLVPFGGALPLGHLFAWPFPTPPTGAIICNGGTYSRTLYADFYSLAVEKGWVKTEAEWQSTATANNGYCNFYSDGNGTDTFRVPKFAPFMQIAIAGATVGSYHEAGLPNIEGTLKNIYSDTSGNAEDALTLTLGSYQYQVSSGSGSQRQGDVTLNASDSSPIYGKSSTVQPESQEWIICVQVFGTATNVGNADVANVMDAIASLATVAHTGSYNDLLNKPQAYITETWHSGTSWYRKYSDGWIEQGGSINGTELVTLNTNFSNTNYTAVATPNTQSNASSPRIFIDEKTTSAFYLYMSSYNTKKASWYACGY